MEQSPGDVRVHSAKMKLLDSNSFCTGICRSIYRGVRLCGHNISNVPFEQVYIQKLAMQKQFSVLNIEIDIFINIHLG